VLNSDLGYLLAPISFPRFLPVQSSFSNESCLIPIVYDECLLAILYRATGLHLLVASA